MAVPIILVKKAVKRIDREQMDRLIEVKPSKIHGKGIFAKKPFKSKELIGLAMAKIRDTGNPDVDWMRLTLGRFLNFSSRPNAEAVLLADKLLFIQAKKQIRKGQEITVSTNMEFFK